MGDHQMTATVAGLVAAARDFATVDETAAIMRCDVRTVRRRCVDGTIPGAVKIGDWRIPVRWLSGAALLDAAS